MRAAFVAMLTVGIAAGSHVLGGGAAPHPLTLLILSVLTAIPVHLLSGRRFGFGLLLVLLGSGQFAIHHLLMAIASMQPGGHPHDLAHQAAAAPSDGPGMILAHLIATVLTSLLLAYGDALLWALWTLLRPLLVVHFGVAVAMPRLLPAAPIRRPLLLLAGPRPDRPRGPPERFWAPSLTW